MGDHYFVPVAVKIAGSEIALSRRGRLCSVVFEIRYGAEGEYYHLVTAWKATKEEEENYTENT